MMGSVGIRDRNTRKGAVSPVQNETICGRPHPNVPSTPPPCSLKLPDGPKMRIADKNGVSDPERRYAFMQAVGIVNDRGQRRGARSAGYANRMRIPRPLHTEG